MGVLTNLNYEKLKYRILNSLKKSDIDTINSEFKNILGKTLILGVGGSLVVSKFAEKVLELKNNCICKNVDLVDMKNFIKNYDSVFAISYSGENYSVKMSMESNIANKYLMSTKILKQKNITNLTYVDDDKEKSFISLSATMIPMSILLKYYYEDADFLINDMFSKIKGIDIKKSKNVEIITSYESLSASTFLESTLTEAGIATCVIHQKYNYCHGRTTLATRFDSTLIYFVTKETDLDKLILEEVKNLYEQIIVLKSNYNDLIIDDYFFTLQSMYLAKNLAKANKLDLSVVKYADAVKHLYYFKGGI